MAEIPFDRLKKIIDEAHSHRTQYPAPPYWQGQHCALCISTDVALLELIGEDGEHVYLEAPICNPHLSALLVFDGEDDGE